MSTSHSESKAVPDARLAATILMLRDGEQGLEVFMVVRHQKIDFATGALVFPGGKLAPTDSASGLEAHCTGYQDLTADQRALRVGAIREAFEECGMLLARKKGERDLIDADRLAPIGEQYRKPLDRGETGMLDMLLAENLELACETLMPFAHWITPTFMPKRFDTHFYLARAPAGQVGRHDGREMVDSVWIRPADAIAQAKAGSRTIVPATLLNVEKLAKSDSVDQALENARASQVVTVLPEARQEGGNIHLSIPANAGYEVTEFSLPGSL